MHLCVYVIFSTKKHSNPYIATTNKTKILYISIIDIIFALKFHFKIKNMLGLLEK